MPDALRAFFYYKTLLWKGNDVALKTAYRLSLKKLKKRERDCIIFSATLVRKSKKHNLQASSLRCPASADRDPHVRTIVLHEM